MPKEFQQLQKRRVTESYSKNFFWPISWKCCFQNFPGLSWTPHHTKSSLSQLQKGCLRWSPPCTILKHRAVS